MNKTLKILFLIIIFITVCFSHNYIVTATDSENSSSEESNNVVQETPSSGLSTLSTSDSVTSVSSMNSYSEANLALNNILSIILIAIGVVLILFAIAILIRLRN